MPSIDISAAAGKEFVPYLKRLLPRAAALLPYTPAEFSVALVGDRRMSQLHQQFLNIPGPTDVLTFEIDHDPRGRVSSGEVIVCVPEARRRAPEHGHAVRDEVLLYALHGLLHLCGYDDTTDASYRRMHRKEDEILTRLGVGTIFATKPAAPPAGGAKPRPRRA